MSLEPAVHATCARVTVGLASSPAAPLAAFVRHAQENSSSDLAFQYDDRSWLITNHQKHTVSLSPSPTPQSGTTLWSVAFTDITRVEMCTGLTGGTGGLILWTGSGAQCALTVLRFADLGCGAEHGPTVQWTAHRRSRFCSLVPLWGRPVSLIRSVISSSAITPSSDCVRPGVIESLLPPAVHDEMDTGLSSDYDDVVSKTDAYCDRHQADKVSLLSSSPLVFELSFSKRKLPEAQKRLRRKHPQRRNAMSHRRVCRSRRRSCFRSRSVYQLNEPHVQTSQTSGRCPDQTLPRGPT